MLSMTMNQPLNSLYWWESLVKTRPASIQYLQLEKAFHLQQWMLDQALKYPALKQER